VLERILGADRLGEGLATVLPSLAVLLGVTAGLQFATTARMEFQRLLAELVGRHAQSKIIQMATVVDLEAYENPDFHDRLQRAQMAANFRPLNMTMSLMSITGAAIGVVSLLITLLILQPLLVPFVALAYVPVWLATARNSHSYHRFGWGMTPADRKRQYLGMALTAKHFAQEVRSFDLAGYLSERYDRLYEERIDGIRDLGRARLRRSLLANLASSVLSAVSIAVLVALLLSGRMEVASAAAAAVAIHQLGGRLATISQFGGQLYEDALFLDEPTSALDPRAEHELFAFIREMAKGRTILLISHRFSSVRSADRIFVLQSGRLVEQGTHDDLMGSGGLYAELFSLQAAAYL
jgi:ATP-binding cassette subfamily B protein